MAGPSTPLVELHFEQLADDARAVRHWYHVPVTGDWIELLGDPYGDGEPIAVIRGAVAVVMWGDDYVVVRVR